MYNEQTYFYENQLQNYILQFMRIFQGLVVKTGKRNAAAGEFVSVPITYGSKDRVAAALLANNTQNVPLRLPTMSAFMRALSLAPDRNKGVSGIKQSTYLPRGGVMPTDLQSVTQLMPVTYRVEMELAIMSTNLSTQYQILEQILPVFNPLVQIQTTDATYDWTKLTSVELKNISYEENYPMGTERRIPVTTLTFEMPVYLSIPATIRSNIVQDIYLRIGATAGGTDEDILDAIKDEHAELIISASEIFSSNP
jgi:hypothetical protein